MRRLAAPFRSRSFTALLTALLLAGAAACGGATTAHAAKKRSTAKTAGTITLNNRVVDLIGGVNGSQMKGLQKKFLEYASQSNDPIWLRIDSPGGSVGAGLILINTFEAIEAPIHCLVEGKAYSMAAILLTYCDKKYGFRHSTFMLHEASYGSVGDDPSNRSKMDFLTKYLDRLHIEIAKNMGMPVKEYRPKIRDAWWLLADEAQRVGLIDAIVDRIEVEEVATSRTEVKQTVTQSSKGAFYPDGTPIPNIPKRR